MLTSLPQNARSSQKRTPPWRSLLLSLLPMAGCASVTFQVYQATGAEAFFRATDFRAFYAAGQIVAAGRGSQLFDLQEQVSWQAAAVGLTDTSQLLAYFNPPFAALPFALLSQLPLAQAYALWTLVNLALIVLIGVLISDLTRAARPAVQIALPVLSLTFLPVLFTVAQGQWSLLLTVGLLLSWRALRQDKPLQAGLWLGILLIKPQLLPLPVILLLWQRRWRAVAGLLIAGVAALAFSLAVTGGRGLLAYAQLVSAAAQWGDRFGIHPQAMYTLRGLAHAALRSDSVTAVLPAWLASVTLLLGLLGVAWGRRRAPGRCVFALQWAALVVAALLLSPHAYSHELSLLIVPGTLVISTLPPASTPWRIAPALLGYPLLSLALALPLPWRVYTLVALLVAALVALVVYAEKAGAPAGEPRS